MQLLQKPRKPENDEQTNNANSVNPADLAFSNRGDTWRNIRLIIGREYNTRVRRKMFVVATLIMVVLIIIASFIPTLITLLSANSQTKLAVIDNTGGPVAGQDASFALSQVLNINTTTAGIPGATDPGKQEFKITPEPASRSQELRDQVLKGDLDGLITLSRTAGGDLNFDFYTKGSKDGLATARIQQAFTVLAINDRLARSGLPQNQVSQIFSPPEVKVNSAAQEKAGGQTDEERGASYLLAFALVIVLFMTIYGYGVAVAQGAAEEKSNRVMEIMVSAATPFQLMMGKIIGIGLAGFTQAAALVVAGILAFMAQNPIKEALLGNKTGGIQVDITKVSVTALAYFLIFYILGFVLYASLYAAVGSLVSRQEDVQGALTPLSVLNTAGYMITIFGLQAIDATWVTVLSYIPFFTPMTMFGRLVLGTASWWEGLVSIGIMLVSTIVLTWLSSRVYRAGVLLYGRKPTTAQIFKLMWAKGR
jgi:ABC-2 type transport system permease protein